MGKYPNAIRLTPILTAFLSIPSHAEGESTDAFKHAAADCKTYYSSPALDPLRARLPVNGDPPTAAMRNYERKANAQERAALRAYEEAVVHCVGRLSQAAFPTDLGQQQLSMEQARHLNADRLDPLMNGQITFAEFFRRGDERAAKIVAQRKWNAERSEIEGWLRNFPADLRSSSLWPGFSNDALAIADQIDSGQITRDDGMRQLEARRLRFNDDVANASRTTLNCVLQPSVEGPRLDRPVVIDYAKSQVNGYPAQFSENSIQWKTTSSDGHYTYINTLNRLSGSYTIGSDEFPALFTGQCAPARRQF